MRMPSVEFEPRSFYGGGINRHAELDSIGGQIQAGRMANIYRHFEKPN